MQVKETPVRLGVPACESSMDTQFQHALFVDPSLDPENLIAKDLQKATSLTKFFKGGDPLNPRTLITGC